MAVGRSLRVPVGSLRAAALSRAWAEVSQGWRNGPIWPQAVSVIRTGTNKAGARTRVRTRPRPWPRCRGRGRSSWMVADRPGWAVAVAEGRACHAGAAGREGCIVIGGAAIGVGKAGQTTYGADYWADHRFITGPSQADRRWTSAIESAASGTGVASALSGMAATADMAGAGAPQHHWIKYAA